MRNFRELNIWQKGIEIIKDVYSIFPMLPDYEKFGLLSQLSRSAGSIPSNIAEGSAKSSDKDFKRFLEFSLGSSYELETHLVLAKELHGIETHSIINKVQEEQRMLSSFINKL
jgi:four helix bundle protein